MNIRLASLNDMIQVMKIREDAVRLLKDSNIDQWQYEYPSIYDFIEDINQNQLYVVEKNGVIVCFGVLSLKNEPSYSYVFDGPGWSKDEPYMVIHRLAMKSDYQGQGIAKYILECFEKIALENNIYQLRIDTHKANFRTNKLFRSLGYQQIGKISLDYVTVGDKERLTFEKLLKK